MFVGVGDIAACTNTNDTDTAAVIQGIDGNVFTVGDNVYPNGTAADFTNCYAPTWGIPSIKSRTRPIPGNHDWGTGSTDNLDGYNGYFGAAATDANGKSYYSYDIPSSNWHIVNLDSECEDVPGGCAAGSAQELWLKADLAANSSKNVIALWHKPIFSSAGSHLTDLQPFVNDLYAAGADLVLDGHDHVYETIAPLDASGTPDAALRHPLHHDRNGRRQPPGLRHPIAGSEVREGNTYGILKLTLHPTSYDWKFLPVAGSTFTDSGTQAVHDAPPSTQHGAGRGGRQLHDAAGHGEGRCRAGCARQRHGRRQRSVDGGAGVERQPWHACRWRRAVASPTRRPTATRGPDSFTYKANDGTADSNTVTVSLTVTAPAATRPAVEWLESVRDVGHGTADLRSATFTVEMWFKRTGAGVGTSTGTGGITTRSR